MAHHSGARRRPWFLIVALAASAAILGACRTPNPAPPAPRPTTPTPIITQKAPAAASPAAAAGTRPATTPAVEVRKTALAALPSLPAAFRFEMLVRPANAPNGPDTEITGVYKSGSWQRLEQTRTGSTSNEPAPRGQETIAAAGATFTRPADEPVWTRWPGTSFDAAYGLTSPFTVLRLFAAADQKVRGESVTMPGVSEPVFRVQGVIAADTVRQMLQFGAAAVAPDADTQRTLVEQVAPLAVTQTVTFWSNEQGRVYRAAATLLTADKGSEPAPWMQATWRFWGYDDPSLAVEAPTQFRDAPGPAAQTSPMPTASQTRGLATQANLAVRVFASPGVPADDLAVSVYPAGDSRQPIDWRNLANAQFALPPGRYDVLVQMDYAQQWVRGLEVKAGTTTSQDITFDFGTLTLSVVRDGRPLPVDIVIYPGGNRQNWVDWRSDNPASFRLRAGVYDVEIAYDDYKSHQTITGLQIKTGETTAQTVTLTR